MYPSVRRRYHFRLQPTDTRAMSSCGCQLSQMVFSLYIRLGSCEFIDELGMESPHGVLRPTGCINYK